MYELPSYKFEAGVFHTDALMDADIVELLVQVEQHIGATHDNDR